MPSIIQIIPAPPDLEVVYPGTNREEDFTTRVICLALIEDEKKRYIYPVTKWDLNSVSHGNLDDIDPEYYDEVCFVGDESEGI